MSVGLSENDGSYRSELVRKGIHLSSLLIPVFYFYLTKENALKLIIPLTALFILIDIARYYSKPLQEVFLQTFGWLLRKHETDEKRKRLNGASYVMISATLCILIFPKIITLTCFTILIISDTTAALIGRRFGKHRFFSKSLEGSLAFLFSGLLVILFTPKSDYLTTEYLIGFGSVLVGMIVEALPVKIDDNLSIPLSVGGSLWLFYATLLPLSNIYLLG